jgi:hypothetical protein
MTKTVNSQMAADRCVRARHRHATGLRVGDRVLLVSYPERHQLAINPPPELMTGDTTRTPRNRAHQ